MKRLKSVLVGLWLLPLTSAFAAGSTYGPYWAEELSQYTPLSSLSTKMVEAARDAARKDTSITFASMATPVVNEAIAYAQGELQSAAEEKALDQGEKIAKKMAARMADKMREKGVDKMLLRVQRRIQKGFAGKANKVAKTGIQKMLAKSGAKAAAKVGAKLGAKAGAAGVKLGAKLAAFGTKAATSSAAGPAGAAYMALEAAAMAFDIGAIGVKAFNPVLSMKVTLVNDSDVNLFLDKTDDSKGGGFMKSPSFFAPGRSMTNFSLRDRANSVSTTKETGGIGGYTSYRGRYNNKDFVVKVNYQRISNMTGLDVLAVHLKYTAMFAAVPLPIGPVIAFIKTSLELAEKVSYELTCSTEVSGPGKAEFEKNHLVTALCDDQKAGALQVDIRDVNKSGYMDALVAMSKPSSSMLINDWNAGGVVLINKKSKRCMSAQYGSVENGTPAIIWDCGEEPADDMIIRLAPAKGKDGYGLVLSHSESCLDIAGSSKSNGAKLHQWNDCSGNDNQIFDFIPDGSGYHSIKNVNSGKCMDLVNQKSSNDTKVHQWSCHGGDSQKWKIGLIYPDERNQITPSHQPVWVMGERNLCLTADQAKTNSPVSFRECGSAGERQIWKFDKKGQMHNVAVSSSSNNCLGGSGSSLTLSSCNGSSNRSWYLNSYRLKMRNGNTLHQSDSNGRPMVSSAASTHNYNNSFSLLEVGVNITSRKHSSVILKRSGSGIQAASANRDESVAQWILDPVYVGNQPRYLRIRNRAQPGQFLQGSYQGKLSWGGTNSPDQDAAQWALDQVGDGYFAIRNRKYPSLYIGYRNGQVKLVEGDIVNDQTLQWRLDSAGSAITPNVSSAQKTVAHTSPIWITGRNGQECLTAAQARSGSAVKFVQCAADNDRQKWTFDAKGHLHNVATQSKDNCLHIQGGGNGPGVVLYKCRGYAHETWDVVGSQLRSRSGKVLYQAENGEAAKAYKKGQGGYNSDLEFMQLGG